MARTVSILLTVLMLLLLVSCSGEGVVDDIFTVTVTYDGNGSTSGAMAPQKVGRGIDARLEANAFEKTDYRFTGWNTASDGSGIVYADCQSINTKEDITLYAQWELDLNDAIILTSDSYTWTDGNIYTLNNDVTIDVRAGVIGDVTLIIPDGYTLTASRGIVVSEGNSLTINGEGSGTLIIPDGGGGAGIGGDGNQNCGNITINSGKFNISAGYNAGAGIGGGPGGNGGNITINGGTINVIADGGGAGIGGGDGGNGGTVTINGGTINVSGSSGAASIGRGSDGTDDGTITLGDNVKLTVSDDNSTWSDYDGTHRKRYMKTVTILSESSKNWTDGNTYTLNSDVTINERVTVTGSVTLILTDGNTLTVSDGICVNEGNTLTIAAEGLGTGELVVPLEDAVYAGIGSEAEMNCGTIICNGGNVTVSAGPFAAGIGSGVSGDGGDITINGGTISVSITITDSCGAGIGCGAYGNGGRITINGGTVTVSNVASSSFGAGIGSGYNVENGGDITINGGTVTVSNVSSFSYGAGIGSGYNDDSGEITINSGTIEINGGEVDVVVNGSGAGIGGGSNCNGGDITINGGTVAVNSGGSGAGIGGGYLGNPGNITINGGTVTAYSDSGYGIGPGSGGTDDGTFTLGDGVAIKFINGQQFHLVGP